MSNAETHEARSLKQANYWLITWNNPPEDWRAALLSLNATASQGQLEKGQSGTSHIQALLYYADKQTRTRFKGFPCWAGPIRATDYQKVKAYVTKEETRLEGPVLQGNFPARSEPKSKVDLKHQLQLVKTGRLEDIDEGLQIRNFGNLQRLSAFYSRSAPVDTVRGVWVYGPPGLGKTHYARAMFPNAYLKSQNKWWDGYRGEEACILDDFDHGGAVLSHLLKIWLDKWDFVAEVKGSFVRPNYRHFVLTSNYLPEEIWPQDSVLCDAIRRRVRFVVFHHRMKFVTARSTGDQEIPNLICPGQFCLCHLSTI